MPAAPSTRNSTLVVGLATILLMLISGIGGYLALRDSPSASSGGGVELGPLAGGAGNAASTAPSGDTSGTAAATTAPASFVLDTPAFTVAFPTAPSAIDATTAWNGAAVPGTQWALADEGYTLYVWSFDYSAAAAVAGFDIQQVLDSVVVGRATEGSTVVANESITVGTDMGRRAEIQAADHAVVLTAVFHGTTLAVVQADVAAGDPPVAYTTAVASLTWK